MPGLVETPAQVARPATAEAYLAPLERRPRLRPPGLLLQLGHLLQVRLDRMATFGLLQCQPDPACDKGQRHQHAASHQRRRRWFAR